MVGRTRPRPPWEQVEETTQPLLRMVSPRRILVVDDIVIVRERVSDLLARHGYIAIPVASGEEAIQQAQAGPRIALALLDVLMPEARIEGIEAARILTHQYHIRCVMLTSAVEATTRVAAQLAGALGYLVKDVVTGDAALLAVVRAALAGEPIPDPMAGLELGKAEALAARQRLAALECAYAHLTVRQRAVADLARQGLTNAEIADALGVEESTVSSHMREVLARLGLTGRRELRTRLVYDSLLEQQGAERS
jgi:two-component system, NarL family, response regulator DevR